MGLSWVSALFGAAGPLVLSTCLCLNLPTAPEIHPDHTGRAHMAVPELSTGGQEEPTGSNLGVHSQLGREPNGNEELLWGQEGTQMFTTVS